MPYKNIEDKRRAQAAFMRRKYRKDPVAAKAARDRHLALLTVEVNAYKIEKGCAHCGYRDNPDALEFDHIVPVRVTGERRFLVKNSRQGFVDAQTNPNIQVLCANCHAIKSVGERKRAFIPA